MNIALWIAQVVLCGMFLNAGTTKLRKTREELIAMHWSRTQVYPKWMIKFIGVMEILGAIGAVLPQAIKVQPWLTPIAAGALGLVMILASMYHATHKEYMMLKITLPLFVLALFVACGRWELVNFLYS